MRIAIATESREKITGITKGFEIFFETNLEVKSQKTESGVPDQPFNYDIFKGAKNRINNLRIAIKDDDNLDFYASCEAGIENFGELYFNVQVVCIYDVKNEKYLYGKSMGWQIPKTAIEMIKKSNLDIYLKSTGIFSIEELLGSENTRSAAVTQATEMALASARL